MSAASRRIGILAGGGSLPVEFAKSLQARGELVHIVSIDGPGDERFGDLPLTRVGMGEVGRMLRAFRTAGARDIVIIGPAKRPDLKRIKPDLGFFRHLPQILRILASGGDDGVLTGVVRFFEGQGFRVLGPADVAPETLAPEGLIAGPHPAPQDQTDIRLGLEVIRLLGDLDVGQAVIVTRGRVEAIEGAEGTDRMLAHTAAIRRSQEREGGALDRRGFLVKRPKPGQELRVDMPSIGPGSVMAARNAALHGIAVQAGKVLIADRAELILAATTDDLCVVGIEDTGNTQALPQESGPIALSRLGLRAHHVRDSEDVRLAWELARRLRAYDCGHCAVVAKRYVLGVEAGGEGAMSVLKRVGEWRSRGRSRGARRSGAALFMRADEATCESVGVMAQAGLAGFAIADVPNSAALQDGVIAAADKAGLFVVSVA